MHLYKSYATNGAVIVIQICLLLFGSDSCDKTENMRRESGVRHASNSTRMWIQTCNLYNEKCNLCMWEPALPAELNCHQFSFCEYTAIHIMSAMWLHNACVSHVEQVYALSEHY